MQRIHILPEHEAQKIAAGEVVESPAHVIKELIENALDAGAQHITLYIEQAGKKLIHIIDDGCGMSPEDARLCVLTHATSKITKVDDITSIATFGFRGEALASIAAVSNVTIITKEAASEQGIKLILEAGNIIAQEPTACNTGTELIIHDLLYNMPARKKFLKTDETEWRAILHVVYAFCMAYCAVHIKMFHDGKEIVNCPAASTLLMRIAQIRDYNYAQHMLMLDELTERNMRIHGIITNHQYARFDRTHVFFFVNQRLVKNHALGKALLKGYANVLPPGRFPAAYLFIEVAQETIDVNIHPRKDEVQFLHPRMVEGLIEKAVQATLQKSLSTTLTRSVAPSQPEPEIWHTKPYAPAPWQAPSSSTLPPSYNYAPRATPHITQEPEITIPTHVFNEAGQEASPLPPAPEEQKRSIALEQNYRIVGQYNATYIILEHDDGMLLIDQHAAHERILYELFSQRFADIATIPLLFPQIITLNKDDVVALEPHLSVFAQLGIQLDIFGTDRLSVQALPVHLKNQAIDDIVRAVAGIIIEHQGIEHETIQRMLNEKLRAQMACKAAVKAGDTLTIPHMQQLITDLYATNNHLTCPHGRPTSWLLSLHDIEKKFKRITS